MLNYSTVTQNDNIRAWCRNIYAFFEALGFTPTWQQRQLADAVQQGHPRIAVRSGMGPGKTTVSSAIAMWRTMRRYMARTQVTAPTMKQCSDVFLGEVRKHLERAHPDVRRHFKCGKTTMTVNGEKDWGIFTLTAKKSEGFFGRHNDDMTFIAEEASGVERNILDAAKGTLSNPNSLFLMIGNPSNRDSPFFDAFHSQSHRWHCLHWNAEETPESHWFTRQRNLDILEEYGYDSDFYRISVLGEFPKVNPDSVISEELLLRAMDRKNFNKALLTLRPDINTLAKQFGIDLARKGGDESTIYQRQGMAIIRSEFFSHREPADVVRTAFDWQRQAGWRDDETLYVPDSSGIGQGVLGTFIDFNKNFYEFHFGGKASNSAKFGNKATEAYFHLAYLLKTIPDKMYIPPDPRLIKQLTTRRYYPNTKGALLLEKKEDYLKRFEHSPDRADGLVLAYYDQPAAQGVVSDGFMSSRRVGMETHL